ncbi:MAG: hypothetical protein AAFR82_08195 [Pseudomonadota bacterium]
MGPRILLQMVLFFLPFILFGIYRIAVAEAEQEGRKPWPIRALFGAGLGLALGGWLVLITLDRLGGEPCYKPSEIVDGRMIPAQKIPCDAVPDSAPDTVSEATETLETTIR